MTIVFTITTDDVSIHGKSVLLRACLFAATLIGYLDLRVAYFDDYRIKLGYVFLDGLNVKKKKKIEHWEIINNVNTTMKKISN